MGWSVLLLFQIGPAPTPAATFLFGCMLPADGRAERTERSTEEADVQAGIRVRVERLAIDDATAGAIVASVAGGELDLTAFGAPDLPLLATLPIQAGETFAQPEPAIAARQVAADGAIGAPPGFLTSPTIVDTFRVGAPWSPPSLDPEMLASTATSRMPPLPGVAILRGMGELSGLPFDGAYAERISRFERMVAPRGASEVHVEARFMRPRSQGGSDGSFGIEVQVSSPFGPLPVRVVARRRGEVVSDRTRVSSTPLATIASAAAAPIDQAEVQVFDPTTGDVVLHRLFARYRGASVASRIQGDAAALDDDLTRRAPADRRGRTADVTRASVEVWRLGEVAGPPHSQADAMRRLVGRGRPRDRGAEWFPKGIGGELDVVDRLRGWADAPQVTELVVVDPFLSPATLTRLVRRIGRQDLSVVVLSSLLGEDPDEFGKPADAVALLRTALDEHASEFACNLRVLNLVQAAQAPDGGLRPVGQAFHDRYVRVAFRDGSARVHVLTNSLNKAAGNWPFVLAELPPAVATQVSAYVDGLLRQVDLASGLGLLATIDWSNSPKGGARPATRAASRPPVLGPRLTHDVVRTLAWLRGSAAWADMRWPMGRTDLRRELVSACQARLIHPMAGRVRSRPRTMEAALRAQVRHRSPRTAPELAVLLRGFGELGAWGGPSPGRVARAFLTASSRRLLPDALGCVAAAVPLRPLGSGELHRESLLTMPLGRRLILKTDAAIDAPYDVRSPDYGLTGAILAALGIDAGATLAFLEDTPSPPLREVGHALVLADLGRVGRPRAFPASLRARSLAKRVAGLLYLLSHASDGTRRFDLDATVSALGRAGWTAEDQAWGMAVGYDRAMVLVRRACSRPGETAQAVAEAEAAVTEYAAAVARAWPDHPSDRLLDVLDDILDERGEDLANLGVAIEQAGGDASGLWRRLLRRFDDAVELDTFSLPAALARDRALAPPGAPKYDEARRASRSSAVAYVRLTREAPLTRVASRYQPLLDHCGRQLRDPLIRHLRPSDWYDRVSRLIEVYGFVYRILDEADRAGVTNGAAYFARHVGALTDELLDVTEHEGKGWRAERLLLARDRGRRHSSGLAVLGADRPRMVVAYLDAVRTASQADPDFRGLEAMLERIEPLVPSLELPLLASLGDVLESFLAQGRPSTAVDAWWRRSLARAAPPHLREWEAFVTDYATHRSVPGASGMTGAEERLGIRLGPP